MSRPRLYIDKIHRKKKWNSFFISPVQVLVSFKAYFKNVLKEYKFQISFSLDFASGENSFLFWVDLFLWWICEQESKQRITKLSPLWKMAEILRLLKGWLNITVNMVSEMRQGQHAKTHTKCSPRTTKTQTSLRVAHFADQSIFIRIVQRQGLDQHARMHRLIWAYAVRKWYFVAFLVHLQKLPYKGDNDDSWWFIAIIKISL